MAEEPRYLDPESGEEVDQNLALTILAAGGKLLIAPVKGAITVGDAIIQGLFGKKVDADGDSGSITFKDDK